MNNKNYTKEQAVRIVTECAHEYDKHLKNRRFLLAYKENNTLRYTIVLFQSHNYLHLTGLKIPYVIKDGQEVPKISSDEFYAKCMNHRLSANDFNIDKAGNCHLKLSVLHMVPTMFYNHNLVGDFLRIGQQIEADYFIGMPNKYVSLGFRRHTSKNNYPVSLYKQDINQLTTNAFKIIGIWRLDRKQSVNTYLAREQDEETLTKHLLAIDAPLKLPVTV